MEKVLLYDTEHGPGALVITDRGIREHHLPTAVPGVLLRSGEARSARGEKVADVARAAHDEGALGIKALFEGYFRTGRGDFRQLALDTTGFTDFQREVFDAARRIPPGEVRTYGWLAAEVGHPRAARAAGSCMARNPLPVIVPCHRVVGVGGPGGWSGPPGWKERLQKLEGRG